MCVKERTWRGLSEAFTKQSLGRVEREIIIIAAQVRCVCSDRSCADLSLKHVVVRP